MSQLPQSIGISSLRTGNYYKKTIPRQTAKIFMTSSYQIYLFCIEIFRQKRRPCQNFTAFVLWNLVKLCANQQQRHWVLSKLLSVIVPARKTTQIVHTVTHLRAFEKQLCTTETNHIEHRHSSAVLPIGHNNSSWRRVPV